MSRIGKVNIKSSCAMLYDLMRFIKIIVGQLKIRQRFKLRRSMCSLHSNETCFHQPHTWHMDMNRLISTGF